MHSRHVFLLVYLCINPVAAAAAEEACGAAAAPEQPVGGVVCSGDSPRCRTKLAPVLLQVGSRFSQARTAPKSADQDSPARDSATLVMAALEARAHVARAAATGAAGLAALLWKVNPWILWPLMVLFLCTACLGWLALAVAAQQGRCDQPDLRQMCPAAGASEKDEEKKGKEKAKEKS
mmetsp:Transcript_46339/g.104146  ORF Transcript_46339/g.104146 Transcript_46339/m.104146 type:complete len:178 (+) Transcript_46339:79-612(+)